MLYNYLKIAVRSLLKFKGYFTINIAGLALGLTAGILIMVYVLDELSFDQFHSKLDRIYKVETSFFNRQSGAREGSMETNGWGVGSSLRTYPEVESVLYSRNASFLTVNHEGKRIKQQMHFASEEFFNIFSFDLKEGNADKALKDPYSIVLTESMAKKYFPEGNALSKTLVLADTLQFVVTGVMKDIPSNSHIQLDALISFSTYTSLVPFDYNGGWGNLNVRNYVLLKEGADVNNLQSKIANIYNEKAADAFKEWGNTLGVSLAPLSMLYLTATNGNGMGPLGSKDRLYLLSGIALFVILLACINFINLTTARSVYRAKEVGLRKVVGSSRVMLIRQFLSESFILTLLAFFLALTFSGLLLPVFNQLLAKNYTLESLVSLPVVSGMIGLIIVVTLLSGYYPAVVMSGMKPSQVLKGKLQTGSKGVQLRRTLVVFQFAISVTLVMGTLVVLDQLRFMQSQDLGFAKDEILVINAARVDRSNPESYQTFKNELKQLSTVEDVTYTNSLPGNPGWQGQISHAEEKPADQSISVEYMAVDADYLKTLDLDLVTGKNFSMEHQSELNEGLILNEKAVNLYGWSSAEEAIGKKIASPSGYPAGTVIGVVKNYHQFGLRQEIGPMVMDFNPGSSYMYGIRFKGSNTKALLEDLNELWKKHYPGYDFNYFFLDEDFAKQYANEERLATVFGIFAVVTIIIAVIGLLGLVSFMVITRTKEIGVRKVLGADVLNITALLSKEFLILVVIGNLIAIPLVWYYANEWLQNFATRNHLSPLLFIITLFTALFITLVTISFQTVKAALTDPAKALRYE